MSPLSTIRVACFDWGGTLMSEEGPQECSMADWPEVQVIPSAAECLESLTGKVTLAIATNASISKLNDIRRALRRVGFDGYFEHIFCFTELGLKKDQAEFWQSVTATLGLPLHQVAMVGDSLEQDAVAPRRFGVQGVWFNPSHSAMAKGVEVPVVSDLKEFARWVRNAG
jgi:FMN phosphatase YigB (HAD superfamily)